ncbi:transcription cofactor vestigial-like protein 3 [Chanos chanos]|uniref:Transcription cofactor vestigial-like protein 3 n=1 Tax=Chanos chanos TaxID=29144 RepID=A0A6J2WFY3_CHACN|nr:transcription cofactor vestigial-like protein 3 [Chanos chanos]
MSCLDVMYHQSYGAHHYLPATSAAAAAAYKAAYYHHQQQQQKRFSIYSRIQDNMELPIHSNQNKQAQKHRSLPELRREEGQGGGEEVRGKEVQPAEAEYLSSRCVLFTYFQGDIEDVVDEHFSRALSQPSAFTNETKSNRLSSSTPWKDGSSLSDGQCASLSSTFWGSSYPSQSSVHPDFPATAAFHPADSGIWTGHSLPQSSLPPPAALADSWHYGLSAQSGAGYPHVHEMYPHMHPRNSHPHTHHVLHHAHNPALDPRFSPLLLPSVRASCSPAPHSEGVKSELEPSNTSASNWTASFHGSVDIYDTVLEQEKAKASIWF